MLRARIISGAIGGGLRAVGAIGVIGVLAGSGVAVGLVVLGSWGILGGDTIVDALAPHAVAVGAWIVTMAISSFMQFVGRGRLNGRRLIGRRLANTAVVLGVTAGGVILFGAEAVIWSAAVAEMLAALLWITRQDEATTGTRREASTADDAADADADEQSLGSKSLDAERRRELEREDDQELLAADPQSV